MPLTPRALRDRLAVWQGTVTPEDIATIAAMFDGYSPRNAQLIAMQRPTATDMRGFREWLGQGRVVRQGEPASRSWRRCWHVVQ